MSFTTAVVQSRTLASSTNWNERELICIAWHSRAFTVGSFHFRPAQRQQYGFIGVTTLWSFAVIVTRPLSSLVPTLTNRRGQGPATWSAKPFVALEQVATPWLFSTSLKLTFSLLICDYSLPSSDACWVLSMTIVSQRLTLSVYYRRF